LTRPANAGDTTGCPGGKGPAVKLFTEHPHSVGETYGEHLKVASSFGFALIGAGLASLLHGLCPWLFQSTGSRTIKRLYHRLTGRGPAEAGYGDWEGAGV
jgi:hypothetical protein